ncbi:hypothetical protein BH10BAC4_BH10BAC4_13130 [soil metagenome]
MLVVTLLASCSAEPEPIAYGKDSCHTCKMTLVDNRFGAEIVTKKGKVYKFDDMTCMINFYNSGQEKEEDMAFRLAVDFNIPGQLVNAQEAFYSKSPEIKSPMGGQVAAFSTKEQFQNRNEEWHGILLTWGELLTQYK